MKKLVFSRRLLNIRAAEVGTDLITINGAAGFGPNYIYRLTGDTDNINMSTVNRLVEALNTIAGEDAYTPLDICMLMDEEEGASAEAGKRPHMIAPFGLMQPALLATA